jgi:hypothetical protein
VRRRKDIELLRKLALREVKIGVPGRRLSFWAHVVIRKDERAAAPRASGDARGSRRDQCSLEEMLDRGIHRTDRKNFTDAEANRLSRGQRDGDRRHGKSRGG